MYLDWLKAQVSYFMGPKYNELFFTLNNMYFLPIIPRDENREADGIALRDEYYCTSSDQRNIKVHSSCTFLEFLVALARRMNYIYARIDEDRLQDCFWMLINNMGLMQYTDEYIQNDPYYTDFISVVKDIIDRINNRTYDASGEGGLFPLKYPRTDQRNVEIWYQMQQYLNELIAEEGR